MRILHTSDWHIGARLGNQERDDEHRAFLGWLTRTIIDEKIDALLVAGDVFDTGTPSCPAQELYSNFLESLIGTCCHGIIITGGNHDSPALLKVNAKLLSRFNVHVIGCAPADPEDEVITLENADGTPGCVVCAVPYLRDRDVRTGEFGLEQREIERRTRDGIVAHYAAVTAIARGKAAAFAGNGHGRLPVIAMGHLFAVDARMEDGEKEIVVGTLGAVNVASFCEGLDYVALGHLHSPQKVGGNDRIRYSGSPLRKTFGKRDLPVKKVLIIDCSTGQGDQTEPVCSVTARDVPVFRELLTLEGDDGELRAAIREAAGHPRAFLEIRYRGARDGKDLCDELMTILEDACPDASERPVIVKMKTEKHAGSWLDDDEALPSLDDLSEKQVFERLLESRCADYSPEQLDMLRTMFDEIVSRLDEGDAGASPEQEAAETEPAQATDSDTTDGTKE